MTTALATALDAFYLEHRRCGELKSGVGNDLVIACIILGVIISFLA